MKKNRLLMLLVFIASFLAINSNVCGQRITVDGNKFKLNGSEIFLNGSNTPWISWNDFGIGRFNYNNWNNAFKALKDNGVNSTRVWISCNGEGNALQISSNGYVSGPTNSFLNDLDDLVEIAENNGVYLMVALISFDHTIEGNPYWDRWRKMYESNSNMNSFVENYAVKIAKRYNNNPYFFSIDVCNEIMWVSDTENNNRGNYSWSKLQYLVGKTAQRVHEESDVLVCVSNYIKYTANNRYSGNKWSNSALQAQVNDADAYVDFYKIHYYSWVHPWFGGFHYDHTPSYYDINDKPCISGEISAEGAYKDVETNGQWSRVFDHSLTDAYERHLDNGWRGCMAWTSNGVDSHGDIDGPHGDATIAFKNNHYSLVYPSGGVTTYTLTVNSGSGDGSYSSGTTVNISANAAPSGKQFKEWTGATVANKYNSSTSLTMPSSNTTVTATYEDIPTNDSYRYYRLVFESSIGGTYVELYDGRLVKSSGGTVDAVDYFKTSSLPKTESCDAGSQITVSAVELKSCWTLNHSPKKFKLEGSNNNSSWSLIKQWDNLSASDYTGGTSNFTTFSIGNKSATVAINNDTNESLKVYPNPVNDGILFVNTVNDNAAIEIYNLQGQKVYSSLPKGKITQINTSNLKGGVYFVKVDQETLKLIVK